MLPVGPVNINLSCCCDAPGTTPPDIAPYVVSLNGLSGILTLDGQGGIDVTAVGGTIFLTLNAAAGLGTVTQVAATAPAAGFTIAGSPINTAGTFVFTLSDDLAALEGLSSTGFSTRTAANTWAQRLLQAPLAGLTITNPAGIAGNPTFALSDDLAALEGLATTGIACRTAASTWATRTLTGPAAGITVSNGGGVAGNPTLALANDLAALEALSGTGYAQRTGVDAWMLNETIPTNTTHETWVDELADPALSIVERFDRPFQSIATAVAGSQSGDCIYVRPALWNERNLLGDGFNQNWAVGSDLFDSSTTDGSTFSDGSDGAGAACTTDIFAPLSDFSRNANPSAAANPHATFRISNSNSTLRLVCGSLFNQDGATNTNNTSALLVSNGVVVVEALDRIECEVQHAVIVSGGTLTLKARSILGSAVGSFSASGLLQSGGTVQLDCDSLGSGNGFALNASGGTLKGSIRSITAGAIQFAGVTAELNLGNVDAPITISSGTVTIHGMNFVGGAGTNGVSVTGGTLVLDNCIINTSANSGTNPITKSGGTLKLRNCILIANGSRDSIEAATPQTVEVQTPCSAKTAPDSVNITLSPDAGFFINSLITS